MEENMERCLDRLGKDATWHEAKAPVHKGARKLKGQDYEP